MSGPIRLRIPACRYGISYSPLDGSIWGSSPPHPGYVIRLDPGSNPPNTSLVEVYKVPAYGIRSMDIDRNGVVWVPLDSGHIGSFDRRKCKGSLNDFGRGTRRKMFGRLDALPAARPLVARRPGAAENPYYVWVDQHDVLGLGANTPIATTIGLTARAGRRPRDRTTRALPDGIFRQTNRWPHRRSEYRMQRPRPLGDVRQPRAGAYRRRRCSGARRNLNRARWSSIFSSGPIRWRIERAPPLRHRSIVVPWSFPSG